MNEQPPSERHEKYEAPGAHDRPLKHQGMWRAIALIFCCFVSAALGAILVLVAQDDLRQTIVNNTREVIARESEIISNIADTVGKSTVAITTQTVTPDTLFSNPEVFSAAGTGIIISQDGYIITNSHVIPEGVDEVTVTLSDGRSFDNVKVVGRGRVNDVAFLKIRDVSGLKPADLGNSSQMEVGEKVIAIGNALGRFQNTVTVGVLSGVGRPIVTRSGGEVQRLENLFQTDAAINPGNSGGPLVNLEGEVIGINTAVAKGAEGIGFAIPIDDVKGLIKSVVTEGELIRPFLGVRTVTVTPAIAAQVGIEAENGAYIVRGGIVEGSPADQAGLKPGDVIVKVEGQKVNEDHVLGSVIAQYDVGETISLTIKRDGETKQIEVTLAEFPDNL